MDKGLEDIVGRPKTLPGMGRMKSLPGLGVPKGGLPGFSSGSKAPRSRGGKGVVHQITDPDKARLILFGVKKKGGKRPQLPGIQL